MLKHINIILVYSRYGFKFCEFRPKWCILTDSHGTHSVCVCTIHQNAILLTDAIDIQVIYKDLISKIACSLDSADCMIHRCEKCPGNENLRSYLRTLYNERNEQVFCPIYIILKYTHRRAVATGQVSQVSP